MAKASKATMARTSTLHPVDELAGKYGLPGWEAAGLMRAARWAEGRRVSEADFESALNTFRNRPQGGGAL